MSAEMFRQYLRENNLALEIIETSKSTKTAQEAALAHNVPVSNIVKSLLVKIDSEFVLHLVPGDKRLDLEKLKKEYMTNDVRMASASEVKEITGYSIGGVPPFGHKGKIETVIEKGFDENTTLIAAAGSPNSTFQIKFRQLRGIISNI